MQELQNTIPVSQITPRVAIAKALETAKEYYADQNPKDIALEEVQRSDDGRQWLITVGISIPVTEPVGTYAALLVGLAQASLNCPKYQRIYKVFAINDNDGTVVSMKIRNS